MNYLNNNDNNTLDYVDVTNAITNTPNHAAT